MFLTAGQWRHLKGLEPETVDAPNQGPRPKVHRIITSGPLCGVQLVKPVKQAPAARDMTVMELRNSWLAE